MAYAAALLLMLLATLATTRMPAAHAAEIAPVANVAGDSVMAVATDAGTMARLVSMTGDQAASLLAGTETLGYVCQTFSPYSGCGPYYPSYGYPYYGNYDWYSPYASYPYSYYGYGYSPYWYGYYGPYWGSYWP
jgi:hypothetical protein